MEQLISKEEIVEMLRDSYKTEIYNMGIKVWMNDNHYIDISRHPDRILTLTIYRNNDEPISTNESLKLLEDYGMIRASSLLNVLNRVSKNF